MTLEELSEAWNQLRNAALGRGITPLVSQALAAKVAERYAAWREYYTDPDFVQFGPADLSASSWVTEYRTLAARVKAEGIKLTYELPTTLPEHAGVVMDKLGLAAIVVGVPLIFFIAYRVTR